MGDGKKIMQAIGFFSIVKLFNLINEDFQGQNTRYLLGNRPFSFYLLSAATAVGVVGVVVAFVLQFWPFVFFSLILAGTALFSAYQIDRLVCNQEVEENVAAFEDKLGSLEEHNQRLKYLLHSLKDTVDEHFKQELEGILEMYEKSYDISDAVKQMDALTVKMQVFTKQNREVQSFNQKFLEDLQQFSELALSLQNSSLEADERLQALRTSLSHLTDELHSFNSQSQAFEENNALYERLNGTAEQMWAHMRSYLQEFHSLKEQVTLLGEVLGSKTVDIARILEEAHNLLYKMQQEKRVAKEEVERSSRRVDLVNRLLESL